MTPHSNKEQNAADKGNLISVTPIKKKVGNWFTFLDADRLWWSREVFDIFELPLSQPILLKDCFQAIHPKDYDYVSKTYYNLCQTGSYHIFYRIVVNQKIKWIEEIAYVLKSGKNPAHYPILGFIRNMDHDPQQKGCPQNQMTEQSSKTSCLQGNFETDIFQQIDSMTASETEKICPVDFLAIYVLEQDQLKELLFHGLKGIEKIKKWQAKSQTALACFAYGEPIILQKDMILSEEDQNIMQNGNLETLIYLPIMPQNKTIGIIVLGFCEQLSKLENQFHSSKILYGHVADQLKNALFYQQDPPQKPKKKEPQSDLELLFQDSIDNIIILNQQGYLQKANPTFCQTLGYTEEELLHRHIGDFLYETDKVSALQEIQNLSKNQYLHDFQTRYCDKEGQVILFEWNATYLKASKHIVALGRNITNQQATEAKNRELEKSISLEKMKTEFFSELSHEFKTPLNVILSSLQLLKIKMTASNSLPERQNCLKYLSYMEQNAYKLLRLSYNLIDITRINNGFLPLLPQNYNIKDLILDIVQSVRDYANVKNIEIRMVSRLKHSPYLNCDQDKIDRILLNLLSNAIKNTQPGGKIRISLWDTNDFIKVSIKDTGCGIAPEFLPYVFDKFHVSQVGFTRNCDGSGVGLSIVKSLVEMHHGTIGAKSKLGEGSTFTFTLSKKLGQQDHNQKELLQSNYQSEQRNSRILMEMSDIS